MQNVSSIGKRALTTAVATATMLWSVGFSSFVAPLTAHAAMAGDLVKGQTLSTLYYFGNDGKRYAFPNEKTYFSWYSDFSGVQTISDSQLAAIPLGGNVVSRPGSFWVKIQSDPKVYAVATNGGLRWIETEAVASGLAGSDWNQFVVDVPDVFFADYTVGASLTSAVAAYNGALVKSGTNYFSVMNNTKRLVTSAGFSANRMQSRFALDGNGVDLTSMVAGSDVVSKEAGLSDPAQLPAAAATTGGLSVSLASDTPAAMTVPSQATSVPFLKFNLSASSGSATVNAVTIKQAGVGNTSSVSNVYIYDGSTRLTSGRTMNSASREATFSGLNIALTAGQTKTLTVVVDIANIGTTAGTAAGDTVQYSLAGASAVAGTATVSGSFPITGATMTMSSTDVGSLVVNKSGSIVQPVLGTKQAKIAEFKLTTATEGASVNQIRLDIRDASKHNNYTMYQNNVLVAAGTKSGTDKVDFLFTKPFEIAQGENRIFEVRADVGGEANDEILTAIDETTDVKAVGSKYGFNVAIDIASSGTYDDTGSSLCNSASDTCSFTTVKGGKVTVAFNGPTASKVKPSTTGFSLWNGTITSQNAIQVRELQFDIAGVDLTGPAANNYQSFRLVDKTTGATISGPYEFDSGVSATVGAITMTDDWNMSAGQSIDVSLLVDVKGTSGDYDVASLDTITATYDASTFSARDTNNQDLTVGTDIIPSTDLAGFTQTITTASLSVALSQPPSSSTHVKGTQNLDMLGVSFIAGSATSVKVTAVTFGGTGDSAAGGNTKDLDPTTYITSCSIYDGASGTLISGPESFATGHTSGTVVNVTFSNFNWTIPAGETGKMLARCNFANVAVIGANDVWTLEINDNADITALDGTGDSIATIDGATDVNEVTQTVVQTIASSGTLAVTADGSTPKSTIVLGSSTAVPVATYKFAATTEDFLVKTISLGNCLTTTYGCNAVYTVSGTVDNDADGLTLVVAGNTYVLTENATISAATVAGGSILFTCITDVTACAADLVRAINAHTGDGVLPGLSTLVFASSSLGVVTITQVDGSTMSMVATVTNDGGSDAEWAVTASPTNGSDQIASAVKISYQDANGATQTKSATFSGGKAKFSDLNFKVTTGSAKTLTVSIDTNSVSSTGATSGSRLAANFVPADFDATGVSSGAPLIYDDVSQALSNPMVARKTKPTISLASGSPSGAGIPSLSEMFRFNVSADSRGYVKMNGLVFKFSSTDNNGESDPDWNECGTGAAITMADATKWDLYNASDMSAALDDSTDWTFTTAAGLACTTAATDLKFAVLDFDASATTGVEEIGAGSTKTYVLRVNTSGASAANDDSVRIDIPDQVEMADATVLSSATYNAFFWADDAEATLTSPTATSTTTNGTVTNGAYVKNLPVIGGTVVY